MSTTPLPVPSAAAPTTQALAAQLAQLQAQIANLQKVATTTAAATAAVTAQSLGVHGPYEDAIIKGLEVIMALSAGQTAEQQAAIWQQWIDFWKPIITAGNLLNQAIWQPLIDALKPK